MAVLTDNMRVLELSTFSTVVGGMPTQRELEWLCRRFLTLVVSPSSSNLAGGSGYVMRASNCFGESFACKCLHRVDNADARERRRILSGRRRAFMEEYRAHLAVSGVPGVPRLFGVGSTADGPIVLMEWVDGHTLHSAASLFPAARGGRGHDARMVAAMGASIAKVLLLAGVRAPGFIHRDISPRNIMVKGTADSIRQQMAACEFKVCLIDMGSSYAAEQANFSLTMNSDIWRYGTPEYAAPEMLTRDAEGIAQLRSSPTIDVYALCSVLYELYAGYTPYNMEVNQQKLGISPYRMKHDFGPISLAVHEQADRPLARLIMAGITPNQQERISLDELYNGLEQFLGRNLTADRVRQRAAKPGRLQQVVLRPLPPEQGGGRIDGPLPENIRMLIASQQQTPTQKTGVFRNLFG